jgi:hypothetical protein
MPRDLLRSQRLVNHRGDALCLAPAACSIEE